MKLITLIICVFSTTVISITVSSNGNSPDIKMIGGMMVDVQQGFVPMESKTVVTTIKTNSDKSKKLGIDSKLSINERYRRLIPYMTFYYANDLAPTTESQTSKNVEVEKAEIIEARMLEHSNQRQPKRIIYSSRNIPRYQGNRLTQFNILSANPTKVFYKPVSQSTTKVTPSYNPLLLTSDHNIFPSQLYDDGRFVQKQIIKSPSIPFPTSTAKPYLNLHNNGEINVQYYLAEKGQAPKFRLVPYEQTPPAKVVQENENIYDIKKPIPVPVLIPKEQVYIRPRPVRPQYVYDNVNTQPVIVRKQPTVVSESYYEKRRPLPPTQVTQPVIENGFKPIVGPILATETPIYTTAIPPATPSPAFESTKKPAVQVIETEPVNSEVDYGSNYYQYVVDQPTRKPEEYMPATPTKTTSLADLLNSLQLNKSIPKPITKENVDSSIRTLLQVLNALKVVQQNDAEVPLLSTPKPFVAPEPIPEVNPTPQAEVTPVPVVDDVELQEEPYLAPVNLPSQHIDDIPPGSTSQQFPPPVNSDDEGGTPGRPGVDYPILTTIPSTSFDCKTQRYKGFFADPDTRCQVWHYCDLNGGQASFLCPNGTIFSQAALTCDWWFNVRCASTTQLYVLNESLYKYILPHSPKFPEDYSGPLVDKYLTLKFKEMEEQFKKNKNKQNATEKMDSDEEQDDEQSSHEETEPSSDKNENVDVSTVSEASVIVESPGTSGNVERLQD